MNEQTLLQKLIFHSVSLIEPEGGVTGYRRLCGAAAAEIQRLEDLRRPVICSHCSKPIERSADWYRCADCEGHYHKYCLTAHARDWRPSHPVGVEDALRLFLKQWNACGPNSDFGRYFQNVRDAAEAALRPPQGEKS